MKKDNCSYCGLGLRNKYSFSYGIPDIPRVFGCDRWWCKCWRYVLNKLKPQNMLIVKVVKVMQETIKNHHDWK